MQKRKVRGLLEFQLICPVITRITLMGQNNAVCRLTYLRSMVLFVEEIQKRFLSPNMCPNIPKNSFQVRHKTSKRFTLLFLVVRISITPLASVDLWYACTRGRLEIVWRHKLANGENTLTLLVFPSVKFRYTLWSRCLLHNIIFWQNFI